MSLEHDETIGSSAQTSAESQRGRTLWDYLSERRRETRPTTWRDVLLAVLVVINIAYFGIFGAERVREYIAISDVEDNRIEYIQETTERINKILPVLESRVGLANPSVATSIITHPFNKELCVTGAERITSGLSFYNQNTNESFRFAVFDSELGLKHSLFIDCADGNEAYIGVHGPDHDTTVKVRDLARDRLIDIFNQMSSAAPDDSVEYEQPDGPP